MTRRIYGIRWARECSKPDFSHETPRKGTKAAGLAYERALATALGSAARHGPWFEFEDRNGLGHCQPDFLLRKGDQILVLEAKLTTTREAWAQLEWLYFPVLECLLRGHARIGGAVVAKHLSPWVRQELIVDSLSAAWSAAQRTTPCLHWLPRTPL